MVHLRTIAEAVDWFKERDPDTRITESVIRLLVATNRIPACKQGRDYVIAIEAVENYLSGSMGVEVFEEEPEVKQPHKGKWRIE